MVEAYRRDLLALIERVQPIGGRSGAIECKHFFGGAAGYVDGRIFVTLTKGGLALKLPEHRRAALAEKGARPLRYFPTAPIKKNYVVLPENVARNDDALRPLFAESVSYCLNPSRAKGLGAATPSKDRRAQAKRRRPDMLPRK